VLIILVDTLYGRRPLSWAAMNGHEGVVKVLLEWEGINPDLGDTIEDRSPLLWAAAHRVERAVDILLERWPSLQDEMEF